MTIFNCSCLCWQSKKRPIKVAFLLLLMEARGVEPLSEDHATQASTGVVAVLMSP